ncbi:MAG: glycosyltransferase family 4 protein [Planctomycetota bacterium]
MRIAHVVNWHVYYTCELMNALKEEHDVLLIVRPSTEEIAEDDPAATMETFLKDRLDPSIEIEWLRYRASDPRGLLEVRRILARVEEWRADVVHIQQTWDWRTALLHRALKHRGVRTVYTVHDVTPHPGDENWTVRILGGLEQSQRRWADRVILHSEALLDDYRKRHGQPWAERVRIVPHGAYSGLADAASSGGPGGGGAAEEPRVLFFGRLSRYKGLDVLIDAASRVAKEVPGVRFVIAGRGEDIAPYLERIERPELFEIHNRRIEDEELPGLFGRASVVALPYREASQSGVAALALAFGRPVVATRVGGIPEMIQDGEQGLLVAPGDSSQLAAALIRLLTDSSLAQRLANGARRKAERELSWRAVARRTSESVYAS